MTESSLTYKHAIVPCLAIFIIYQICKAIGVDFYFLAEVFVSFFVISVLVGLGIYLLFKFGLKDICTIIKNLISFS